VHADHVHMFHATQELLFGCTSVLGKRCELHELQENRFWKGEWIKYDFLWSKYKKCL